jgi:hypothetical protein
MVDWRAVGGNGLWILGLSILLAVYSYANWRAIVSRRTRREVFTDSWLRLLCNSALGATMIGWASSQSDRWWERVICLALAALCGWRVATLVQSRGRAARVATGGRIDP